MESIDLPASIKWHIIFTTQFVKQNFMQKEIRNDLLNTRSEDLAGRSLTDNTKIAQVNGHYLPDEDDEAEEDDLVLGDEAEIDEVDYNEDELEVEEVDDLDEDDLDEDDLVLDTDDDEDEEDDKI